MERERIKPIILTDTETGKEYTLEFNRSSIKLAESMDFNIKTFDEKPMTSFTTLWYCSFKMHHPEVSQKKAEDMLDEIGGTSEKLITRLFELYLAGAESLSDKNPKVTVIL